jgi:hypothetical protein
MFLPSWNKRMTTNSYASLHRRSLHICKFLGSIPSDQLQYAEVPFWNNIQTPLPKHTWDMHIIAIVYGILKAETASMLVTKTDKKNLRKKFLRQSGKSIAFIMTPTPLHFAMKIQRQTFLSAAAVRLMWLQEAAFRRIARKGLQPKRAAASLLI